jgi:hypothetical protein
MTATFHTQDIDELFFPRLDEVASELGAQPRHMLAVMYSESGCRADAWNDNPKNLPPEQRWNASGLIQVMPTTLRGLGWADGHAAFRRLSATEQLTYVRRYYDPYRGHLDTVAGLYVATFLPALVNHAGDPMFVLTAKGGPLGWAYAPNAAFDTNGDYAITVAELEDAVMRNCRGPRWAELNARLSGGDGGPVVAAGPFDLRTTMGLQSALTRLGYDVGAIDGIPGPKTRATVAAFQSDHQLTVDGVYGQQTRAVLEAALAELTNSS